MRNYVSLCELEISGFGKLEIKEVSGERFMIITDFEIFEQEVTAAHSTIDEDALGKFLYEKTVSGDVSKWKVWWHSHAAMEAFFSGTDTGTIDKSTDFPYLVSLVSNHKGAIVARLDIYDPVRHTEELEVVILPEENAELKEICQKEIEEKVKKVSYGYQGHHHQHQGGKHHQKGKKNIWSPGKKVDIDLDDSSSVDNLDDEFSERWVCDPETGTWKRAKQVVDQISTSDANKKSTTQENSKPPLR
jgi:hypothetical protein